jgi:hypothetical protein
VGYCVGLLLAITIAAAAIGIPALYGDQVYDDWRCGFSKCVRVKP